MHKCAAGDALKFTQSYSRVQCYGICRYSLQVSEFMSIAMTDSLCTCKLIITSKLIDITIDIKAYVSIEIRIRK